jgi:hypothetical protein
MEISSVLLWILTGITIVIAIYLAIIYILLKIKLHKMKDKEMRLIRSYPCYLNIILSLVIAINNLFRLIYVDEDTVICKIQALILAIFDKLVYTTMTVNSYLTYKGLSDNEYYIEHIQQYFVITNGIGLAISATFGIAFFIRGTVHYNVCYIEGGNEKETSDTIIMLYLFSIFIYSNIKSILFLLRNIKELYLTNNKDNLSAYLVHFYRIGFSLFLSSIAFLVTLLIINDSLFVGDDSIDMCYIFICLIVDLFYTLNSTVFKETKKLICCKDEEDMNEPDFDTDDNEERLTERTLNNWSDE